jgi:hypothetical protein
VSDAGNPVRHPPKAFGAAASLRLDADNCLHRGSYRITNGAGFVGAIEWAEAETRLGTAVVSGTFTMVTEAPTPTMSYNCMMSLERIRMHP